MPVTKAWKIPLEKSETASGIGNWSAFNASPFTIHDIMTAAETWKAQLKDHPRLWLCWNVDPAWCVVQQLLVKTVGWTPLVGFDPRVGPPPLVPGAICIDFNESFSFKTMYPHFPIEFAFAFAERLAFWHSDLLIHPAQLENYAQRFSDMPDGKIIATKEDISIRGRLRGKRLNRAWELLGCVTQGGSLETFKQGCGWWMCFALHPMPRDHKEVRRRAKGYWDHGTGILYWKNYAGGDLELIPESEIKAGHFTRIGRKSSYKVFGHDDWRRNLSKELSANFPIERACREIGISEILLEARNHME